MPNWLRFCQYAQGILEQAAAIVNSLLLDLPAGLSAATPAVKLPFTKDELEEQEAEDFVR